jgi:tRNA-dihydrouridine synthase B
MIQIGPVPISPPFGLAPMAGMTDSAFRRQVKRRGGCGLVVTEMVSCEGLIRGMDRTLEYAEFTEEERPVSVQIFGGDPARMAEAARVVEGIGADIVDVNMGCPVPKVARHNAGCSLMREPDHAAAIVAAMVKAVRIPVTVKMRAGWNERQVNAPVLAKMVEEAGAVAVAVHGRTAADSYRGRSDWDLIARVAAAVRIPVFGNGDLLEPEQLVERWRSSGVAGVLVGRGVLRNPWICAQAAEIAAGGAARPATAEDRGRFLLEYIDLLLGERIDEPAGFRHQAIDARREGPGAGDPTRSDAAPARRSTRSRRPEPVEGRGRERWVINKVRALGAWFTKGMNGGSRLRVAINQAESMAQLRDLISAFFFEPASLSNAGAGSLAADHSL